MTNLSLPECVVPVKNSNPKGLFSAEPMGGKRCQTACPPAICNAYEEVIKNVCSANEEDS